MQKETLDLKQNLEFPRIRKFSNVLHFLQAYFEYRKKEEDNFSYESWSNELGFNSSSFMYLICKGQRSFTLETAKKIIPFLNLNEAEQKHILLLANFSQAKSAEVKSALFDKILENLEIEEQKIIAIQYKDYVMSETMPLVRMILAYDDAEGTEEEILSILEMTSDELREDLITLEKMELIQKIQLESSGKTIWKALSKAIKAPDSSMNDVLDLFYSHNLKAAMDSIQQDHLYKKFRSLTMAVSPDEYEILENEIDQFANRLKSKFFVNDLTGKHLVKMHVQAYQASRIKTK